jgi:transcription antitermination protein NusB
MTDYSGLNLEPDDKVEVEVVEQKPITGDRSIARHIVLQTLYEVDSTSHDAGQVLARQLSELAPGERASRYALKLITGIGQYQSGIDSAIRRFASEYPLEQLAVIDRNILRIAIYELVYSSDVPLRVAIDEAVELAKVFGAEGTASFINGVLGAFSSDNALIQQMRETSET